MGIKKWSDFGKSTKVDEMKTFTGGKKAEVNKDKNVSRSHVSASSEYADDINQNIIKRKERVNTKNKERKYATKKEETTIKDKSIYPPETKDRGTANMEEPKNENVEFYGRLAKFPNGVKASKAYSWMHNLQDPKLAKKDIWYLMVEKQDNELQMIKYQQKEGVNLTKFVMDLKSYYMNKYKSNPKLIEKISNIQLGGDQEGKKLIHKITEDLVKLLG
jgi:hypothetical protein